MDFCAYNSGESELLLDIVGRRIKQYILISSCSVFQPSAETHGENAPYADMTPQDEVQSYSYNKILLEKEAKRVCGEKDIACTILRPSFVYGPFNYAPRESWYFKKMMDGDTIPVPEDAGARFQFVYVKDIARAIMECTDNEASCNDSYNLAAPDVIDYKRWMEFLDSLGVPFKTERVTVDKVYRDNIPLPFPLDQNELYDGNKITEKLDMEYTPFEQGMKETYEIYKRSFG